MRRILIAVTLPLTLACYGATESTTPPSVAAPDSLRVLGGPVQCDGCAQASFDIGGPGLEGVSEAAFIARDGSERRLSANLELRRFTGDSGVVLKAQVSFTDTVRVGDYDLRLFTPGRNRPDEWLTIARALQVSSAWMPTWGAPASPPPPPPPARPGVLRISATVSGDDLDQSFVVFYGYPDYYYYNRAEELVAGATIFWTLPEGMHTIALGEVQSNCRVRDGATRQPTVVADDTVSVTFEVTCAPLARVRVSATFTGERPAHASASCGDGSCVTQGLDAQGVAILAMPVGAHPVRLGLPSNCVVNGSNPVTVLAVQGTEVPLNFAVVCTPSTATAHIVVRATGSNIDPAFTIVAGNQVADGCEQDYYFPCFPFSVPPNGSYNFTVGVGKWYFLLRDIAANCSLTSGNPVERDFLGGVTLDVTFDVTCS